MELPAGLLSLLQNADKFLEKENSFAILITSSPAPPSNEIIRLIFDVGYFPLLIDSSNLKREFALAYAGMIIAGVRIISLIYIQYVRSLR